MDNNFFDYLFYAFLILSILSSLLNKKKKKTEKREDAPPPVPVEEDDEITKWEQENFPDFSTEAQTTAPKSGNTLYNVDYSTDYNLSEGKEKFSEEVKEDEEKIDEKAKKFLNDTTAYSQTKNTNKIALTIANRISSRDYLKEAFVISEILNKPVGLRIDG